MLLSDIFDIVLSLRLTENYQTIHLPKFTVEIESEKYK